MKKLFISFLLIFGLFSFLFSENIFSVSIAPDFGLTKFSNNTGDYSSMDLNFKFGFDYKYIMDKNFIIGVGVSLQPDSMTIGSTSGAIDGIVLSSSGVGFNLAPIIGYRFGKSHLLGIELLPIIFQHTSLSDTVTLSKHINNSVIEISESQSGSKTVLLSELRGSFQFGNGLVRNGFVVGVGFPWYIDLSTLKVAGLRTKLSDSGIANGFFIEIGYKLSFVK